MISRHWTGVTKPGKENEYINHLKESTFPQLHLLPGFIRASILQFNLPEGTEFRIVTEWESMQAIHAFAGADPEKAVVPKVARDMMIRFDETVKHYRISLRFEV